jgi:hypothetical protein
LSPLATKVHVRLAQLGDHFLRYDEMISPSKRRELAKSSKNSKANPIETGERSGGIGEICSVEGDEK